MVFVTLHHINFHQSTSNPMLHFIEFSKFLLFLATWVPSAGSGNLQLIMPTMAAAAVVPVELPREEESPILQ